MRSVVSVEFSGSNKSYLFTYVQIKNKKKKVAGAVYGTANRQPRSVVFQTDKSFVNGFAYFLWSGGWPHNQCMHVTPYGGAEF
jgi:hypothetical protein